MDYPWKQLFLQLPGIGKNDDLRASEQEMSGQLRNLPFFPLLPFPASLLCSLLSKVAAVTQGTHVKTDTKAMPAWALF